MWLVKRCSRLFALASADVYISKRPSQDNATVIVYRALGVGRDSTPVRGPHGVRAVEGPVASPRLSAPRVAVWRAAWTAVGETLGKPGQDGDMSKALTFREGVLAGLAGSLVVTLAAAQSPTAAGVVVRVADGARIADTMAELGFVAGDAQVITSVGVDVTDFLVSGAGGLELEAQLVAADEASGLGLLAVPGLTARPYPFARDAGEEGQLCPRGEVFPGGGGDAGSSGAGAGTRGDDTLDPTHGVERIPETGRADGEGTAAAPAAMEEGVMMDAGDGLAPGARLDEFKIERVLGSGGFGVTYLARDLSLDTWRAVKEYLPRDWGTRRQDGTIGPRTGGDAEDYTWGLERFLDEARILARFDHRHLVRVHRVFEARGTSYMVTEYVEGRTLAAEVEAEGPLPEARVREVLLALTDGLSAVHAAGLLHRDIKPGNVMVRPDGTPVLIDFGAAARHAMGRHSRSVTAVLTPGYAPLEQYSARGNQGPWTDIYALGAVGYWAVGGGVPEDATERVWRDALLPLAEVAPGRVSPELASAVDAALAVNLEDRPQSLEAWRALL